MGKAVRREKVKRDYRHGMRGESAARCIGDITPGCDIFGLTKGDFSMIPHRAPNRAVPDRCRDVDGSRSMLDDGNIQSMRWLVDRSFPQRQPKYYSALKEKFGDDSVRLARFHAKFILLDNDNFSIAVRTSMNLNLNQRIEFFEISEGSPISGYLREVVDYHFAVPSEDSYGAFKDFKLAGRGYPVVAHRLSGWD